MRRAEFHSYAGFFRLFMDSNSEENLGGLDAPQDPLVSQVLGKGVLLNTDPDCRTPRPAPLRGARPQAAGVLPT